MSRLCDFISFYCGAEVQRRAFALQDIEDYITEKKNDGIDPFSDPSEMLITPNGQIIHPLAFAIVMAPPKMGTVLFTLLINMGANVHCKDSEGHSLLHIATSREELDNEVISLLIKTHKVDVNAKANGDKTALDYLMKAPHKNATDVNVIRSLLIASGAKTSSNDHEKLAEYEQASTSFRPR